MTPLRSVFALLLILAASSATAQSTDLEGLAPAFGAAIVSTHPDGREAKLWLNRDGTWRAESRRHEPSGGTWKLKGGKLCLTQKTPQPGLFTLCKRFPPITVGAVWRDRAFNGDLVENRVVTGR